MYHRFSVRQDPEQRRVDAVSLDRQLAHLRKTSTVWSLGDYLEALRIGRGIPKNLVVLTVDDGYRDFFDIAFPLLVKHQLPATFFPVTDFVEQRAWLWHDKLDYIFLNTRKEQVTIRWRGVKYSLSLKSTNKRRLAWKTFSDLCVTLDSQEMERLLTELARSTGVNVPAEATDEYSPCSWAELALMQNQGIEIGGHTRTHPILTRIDDQALDSEIAGCKKVLESKLSVTMKSFCYPNGAEADVSDNVVAAVRRAGFIGAVVTYRKTPCFDPFRTSRLGSSEQFDDFLWKVHGWEYLQSAWAQPSR